MRKRALARLAFFVFAADGANSGTGLIGSPRRHQGTKCESGSLLRFVAALCLGGETNTETADYGGAADYVEGRIRMEIFGSIATAHPCLRSCAMPSTRAAGISVPSKRWLRSCRRMTLSSIG